jgi:hypothetical protein
MKPPIAEGTFIVAEDDAIPTSVRNQDDVRRAVRPLGRADLRRHPVSQAPEIDPIRRFDARHGAESMAGEGTARDGGLPAVGT